MNYLQTLFAKALSVEREIGTPIGVTAIQQTKQICSFYRLSSPAGRRAAVNAVEELITQKGCKACDVLDHGAADLRKQWKLGTSASRLT